MLLSRPFAVIVFSLVAAATIPGCHHGKTKPAHVPQTPTQEDLLDARGAVPPVFESTGFYEDLRRHTFTEAGVDAQLDVSADGTMLAYASTSLSVRHCVFVRKLNGIASSQKTPSTSSSMYPRFSPDGRLLAFASDRNGNWDVWVTEVDRTGAARQITDGPEDEVQPSWSPDGQKIAYAARNRSGDWELRIADLVTGARSTLGPGMFPVWSPIKDKNHPSYNRLAFQRARQRGEFWFGIWTVNADGGGPLEVHSSPAYAAVNPSWSPDGSKIAFATVNCSPAAKSQDRRFDGDDIWMVRHDGTGLAQITSEPCAEWYPCWSVDGRIYFIARREGAQNIWSAKPLAGLLDDVSAAKQEELK